MVDARAKGARTELAVRDIMRDYTGLGWERVPGSGALDEKHGLKGDLYIPNEKNLFCTEVKGYAEDHLTSAVLSSKSPQLIEFWSQAVRQGKQVQKQPLLIFKFNRSKLFVAFMGMPNGEYPYMFVERDGFSFTVAMLELWLKHEKPRFIA